MRHCSCLFVLAWLSAGCSWSRFDDVVDGSPIVVLNRPKQIESGFGASLATARVGDEVTLLVGGAALSSGAAEFSLGSGNSPTLDATDTGHCMGGDARCYFSNSPVALTGADSPNMHRDLCFIDGVGEASGKEGIVVRCTDEVEYTLGMPEAAFELLKFSLVNTQPTLFRFGADHSLLPTEPPKKDDEERQELLMAPAVLATADQERAVWYYPPLDRDFVPLPNPAEAKGRWDEDQERPLAVARIGGADKLLAVGMPKQGGVRLFRAPYGGEPSYIGCIGGTARFGRALATGPVLDHDGSGTFAARDDLEESDELVISDDSIVYVFDAAKLATLVPTTSADCSLGALPEGTLITSFSCGSTKNISGCDSSDFGAALGVGDMDGDGDGEVVVGAPNMTVRHVDRAGAVVIYDIEPPANGAADELYRFKDIAFLSSADQGDRLGSSIALPQLDGRQVLAAGAPGGGKAALFYCPSFLPNELKGSRCE